MNTQHPRASVIAFPVPGKPASDVEAHAAEAVAKLNGGGMTLAETIDLQIWCERSPDHRRIYNEMQQIWLSTHAEDTGSESGQRSATGRLAPFWRAAAAIVVLAGSAVMTAQYLSSWRYDHRTGAGELRTVNLADGSRATLIGDTAMNVSIRPTGERRIDLIRGDAYFDVRHDERRPFVVAAGSATVRDVGTGFWVKRQGDDGSVVVGHGIVDIRVGNRTQRLWRNEGITFRDGALGIRQRVDARAATAWARGLYLADNVALGTVLSTLDRFYDGKIVLVSDQLRHHRINAVIQLDQPDAWIDALGAVKGVKVRRFGPLVFVAQDKN